MGKCELDSLLYDLKHYDSPDFFDDLDSIWIQILDDISQYSELMDHLHFVECVPICPLISFERPDVLYCDNKSEWVMGIECFRFDASKKTRKGSRQRIEEKKTRDDILKEHQKGLDYIAVKTIDSYVPQIQILNCSDESIDKMMEYCYANESKYISYNYAIESHFHGMRE